jgi:hypothetical protein
MIWIPTIMPTHMIAGNVRRRKGKMASHHHFLGFAFRVWIGAIFCQYVCAGIGNAETAVTVSRRMGWAMRGFGFFPVRALSLEASLLSSYCGSGSANGRQ